MDPILLAIIGICGMFLLIALHVPIGIAMGIAGLAGVWAMLGAGPAASLFTTAPTQVLTTRELGAIPMFLLMGSFSAAARALGQTPSAVSRQIGRLEDRVGVRLLGRSSRGLVITEEGQAFYQRCVDLSDKVVEAESFAATMNDHPRGHLRLVSTVVASDDSRRGLSARVESF